MQELGVSAKEPKAQGAHTTLPEPLACSPALQGAHVSPLAAPTAEEAEPGVQATQAMLASASV